MPADEPPPAAVLLPELARMKGATLSAALGDVDNIIELLEAARDQVAYATDLHTASLTMTKLQNPIKESFETLNRDLQKVSNTQKKYGKALDKCLPVRALPTEYDAMANHHGLINRAIAMHLLREGQFSVASTFVHEAQDHPLQEPASNKTISPLQSQELQGRFTEMYNVLEHLKNHDLVPAIAWARTHSGELEARGSNLEFDLCRLRFVWLFSGLDGETSDPRDRLTAALDYASTAFVRFQSRHLAEIQKLMCAIVFAANLSDSPYHSIFETSAAFEDVALTFTREFCSLLGLSAESPLYVAVTAGAISLPQLLKYTFHMKAKKTEWTSYDELAFETPLPRSMIYHPIFVCPVLKEQTTEANPPMMLPCGHVICREALKKMVKGHRFKCPYCPSEGAFKDAREIKL